MGKNVCEKSLMEAVEVIKEWGVDCDNFVAMNFKNRMVGGDVDDNSMELSEYFQDCLKIVTDFGIKIAQCHYGDDHDG